MTVQITFIRHGETESNALGVWQGQSNSPLSAAGRSQAAELGARLDASEFDRVVASDLGRVLETADLAGLEPQPDSAWREVDIGAWEGLTRPEMMEQFPDQMAALAAGGDPKLGGGESWPEFHARIDAAFTKLVAETADGEHIAVVAHGGVVHSVVTRTLGLPRRFPWPVERIHNTALTRIAVSEGRQQIRLLNDASHTNWEFHPDSRGTAVTIVRHGETEANVKGIWQGRTDTPLTAAGHQQAARLAEWLPGSSIVYSSPLGRARETANYLANGDEVPLEEGLAEMDFGSWEGLGAADARAADPELWSAVFENNEDLPRGGTGETYAQVGERVERTLSELARRHPEGGVTAVSHGGSVRSLAARIVGLSFTDRNRIGLPDNTSTCTVRFGPGGPVLVDYNVRP